MGSILENCGPCGNVLCSQYGCQKQWGREIQHPFPPRPQPYMPMPYVDEGSRVFNVQEAINALEKRVKALEDKNP